MIYDSPVTNSTASYTYGELRDEVATFAGVLDSLGISKSDRAIIYMPMIPQISIAMLACARIGAIHSVVFGGFTAPTAFRAIRKEDPEVALSSKYDLSQLRTLFVAGERTDPSTYDWLCEILGVPVIDHWWQTETGWPAARVPIGLEPTKAKAGSVAMPV